MFIHAFGIFCQEANCHGSIQLHCQVYLAWMSKGHADSTRFFRVVSKDSGSKMMTCYLMLRELFDLPLPAVMP